jgi:hypothetical protein
MPMNIVPQLKPAAPWAPNAKDVRTDGTQKGLGYFGALKRPDGQTSTELSIGVNIDGKEVEIPSLVPSLSREEIDHLLRGGAPTPQIVQKAADFAAQRMKSGLPVFAAPDEKAAALPNPAEQDFKAGFDGTAPPPQVPMR